MKHNNNQGQDDTRERLVKAALEQFAERGFYGASIAQIAGEVGLTKQALLYHFKRKEDLYSEVLKRISERLGQSMAARVDPGRPAAERFENTILALFDASREHPLDTKVLMRELIDDQRRDAPETEWHLRITLNRIAGILDEIEELADLTFSEKFARSYAAVSAVEYFAGSGSVLRRFYGEQDFVAIEAAYPEQLRAIVRALLKR